MLSPAYKSALWQQGSTMGFPWHLHLALEPCWTGHPFQLLGTEVALENKVRPSEPPCGTTGLGPMSSVSLHLGTTFR